MALINSIFTGLANGRSAGFAPFRMRAVYVPLIERTVTQLLVDLLIKARRLAPKGSVHAGRDRCRPNRDARRCGVDLVKTRRHRFQV